MTLLVFMLPRQAPAQCCVLHVPSLERTCQMTGKPPHLKSGMLFTYVSLQGTDSSCYLCSWKFALFLVIDANFHLARKNVSSDVVDPGLNRGWSYFVEDREFKSFLNDAGMLPQEVIVFLNLPTLM
jgi:hypothetical protein